MRGFIAVVICISFFGRPSPTEAASSERVDFKAYYACMDHEAEAAVRREVNRVGSSFEIDTKRIADHIVTLCTASYSNGVVVQQSDRGTAELRVKDALTSVMRMDLEKRRAHQREREEMQEAIDAPKLNRETAAASRAYGDCLFRHAKAIAVVSSEAADTVREATFASCRVQREAILEAHRRNKDHWFGEEALDIADKQLAGALLLEIIKARAAPPTVAPTPSPPSRAPENKI